MPRVSSSDRKLMALFEKVGLQIDKFVHDPDRPGPRHGFVDSFFINGQEFGFFYKSKDDGWVIESYCIFSEQEVMDFLKQIPEKDFTALMYEYEDYEVPGLSLGFR